MSSTRTKSGCMGRVRSFFSVIAETGFVLSSAVDGAAKTALAAHFFFNFSAKLFSIPTQSMAFQVIQYTTSSITFAITTYHTYYCKKTLTLNNQEKLSLLNDKIEKNDKIFLQTSQIYKSTERNLQSIYSYQQFDTTDSTDDQNEQKPSSVNQTSSSTRCKILLQSMFDGTVSAVGIYQLFNSVTLLKKSNLTIPRNIGIGLTAVGKMLFSHEHQKMELRHKENITIAIKEVRDGLNSFSYIKKMLGSRDQLINMITQGEKETKQTIALGIPVEKIKPSKTCYTRIAESMPVLLIKSLLEGSIDASGIDSIVEMVFPNELVFKYTIIILTLLITGYHYYKKNSKNNEFEIEMATVDAVHDEMDELIMLANKLALLERHIAQQMFHEHIAEPMSPQTALPKSDSFLSDRYDSTSFYESTNTNSTASSDIELGQMTPVSPLHSAFFSTESKPISQSTHLLASPHSAVRYTR